MSNEPLDDPAWAQLRTLLGDRIHAGLAGQVSTKSVGEILDDELAQLVAGITPGGKIGLAVDNGRLVVEPKARPRYTMAELLAASDYSQPQPAEEREWVDAPAVGGELILGKGRHDL